MKPRKGSHEKLVRISNQLSTNLDRQLCCFFFQGSPPSSAGKKYIKNGFSDDPERFGFVHSATAGLKKGHGLIVGLSD